MQDKRMNNLEYIELFDGSEKLKLRLLDTFGVDEKDYAALLDDKEDLYIFEVKIEEDDAVFLPIEDDEEFNDILAIYNDLLDEQEDNLD